MTPDQMTEFRDRHHMSKIELAKRLGVDRKTIQRYEDGETKIARQTALACAAIQAGLNPIGSQ